MNMSRFAFVYICNEIQVILCFLPAEQFSSDILCGIHISSKNTALTPQSSKMSTQAKFL